MIRNLKALGLALMAVFAFSALAASTASANTAGEFTSASGYPVHAYGHDINDTFVVEGNSLNCTGVFSGALAKKASPELTIEPTYTECKNNGVDPATVTMNGCDYLFTAGTATTNLDIAHGSVHIKCPTATPIEIHIYKSHLKHTESNSWCTITVGPQTAGGSVTYTSETAAGHVFVEGTLTVTTQLHGECSFGLTLNKVGTYNAGVTVEGTESKKIDVA